MSHKITELSSSQSHNGQSHKRLFHFYSLSLMFILLLEGVMAYYFPIVLEHSFGSNLAAGLVLSGASIVALLCDFLIPELFRKRGWKFLLMAAIIFQIAFPAFTQLALFTSALGLLLLASMFWNIYYEFMAFSRHNFIVSNEKKEDYSKDWSMISIVTGFTAIVGPILGSMLLKATIVESSFTLAALQIVALFSVLLLVFIAPKQKEEKPLRTRRHIKWSIIKEFKIWELLGKRILPVLVLGSVLTIQYSSVSTVGGLLGEDLLGEQNLDWLLIFMFNVPGIFIAIFLAKVTVPRFKKKLSQAALILSGGALALLPFVNSQPAPVIVLFFIASLFSSIAWIFNEAVFSDLSRRSGDDKLYINSLERLNDTFGYLIGPALIGSLSDSLGYFSAFQVIGILCILTGAILLLITPRKLLIPHQELDLLEETK